jgi:hypothetical protein
MELSPFPSGPLHFIYGARTCHFVLMTRRKFCYSVVRWTGSERLCSNIELGL